MKHYLFTSTTAKYVWKSIATFSLFTITQSFMLSYLIAPGYQAIILGIYGLTFLLTFIIPLWFDKLHPKTLMTKQNAVKPIPVFILGYTLISLINLALSFIIGADAYEIAQPNQDVINAVMDHAIYLVLPMTVLLAPIVEELVFREWLPKFFRNIGRKLRINDRYAVIGGFILGSLVFASLHMPTGLQGWVVYGGLSSVLLVVRYKYSIQAAIMMHFYYNTFVMVALLLNIV